MKLACFLLLAVWIAFAVWLGSITSHQAGSIPGDMGFKDEPIADYEGKAELDCQFKLHHLK